LLQQAAGMQTWVIGMGKGGSRDKLNGETGFARPPVVTVA
jgi:hypothetical protein